jgi:hypothetical protein
MAVDAVFTSHGSLDFTLPCLILECFSQISFATLLLDLFVLAVLPSNTKRIIWHGASIGVAIRASGFMFRWLPDISRGRRV